MIEVFFTFSRSRGGRIFANTVQLLICLCFVTSFILFAEIYVEEFVLLLENRIGLSVVLLDRGTNPRLVLDGGFRLIRDILPPRSVLVVVFEQLVLNALECY